MKYALLICLIFFAQITHAQTVDNIDVTVNPQNPSANQQASIDVKSFALDLGQATISWSLNGKIVSKGKGIVHFDFNTESLGVASVIDIAITGKDGEILRKEVIVKPASVDLLWQTNTHTPPFYRGKALYTPQSTITFVAVPHLVYKNGSPIDNKNIVFTWKKDYIVQGSLSGYGKDSFSFEANVLKKPTIVEVAVSAPTENLNSSTVLSINTRDSEIVVYENDPLYGILYNNAITSSYHLAGNEVKFTATPYYFTTGISGTKNLKYSWDFNDGTEQGDNSTDQSIVLRREGDASGSSNISLSVENPVQFFQKAVLAIKVKFENI